MRYLKNGLMATLLTLCVGACTQTGGDVGEAVAELSRPESERLAEANGIEEPGARLRALGALADELVIERALREGVLTERSRSRSRSVSRSERDSSVRERREMYRLYSGVRARVMANGAEIAAELPPAPARVPEARRGHANRVSNSIEDLVAAAIDAADLSMEERAALRTETTTALRRLSQPSIERPADSPDERRGAPGPSGEAPGARP